MRIGFSVGVAYRSDVDYVCELLIGGGEAHAKTWRHPETLIRMRAFGAPSLDYALLFWIGMPEDKGWITHELIMGV